MISNHGGHYRRALTILFGASLFVLSLHVIDDALTTGEPAASGVSLPEFLLYAGLIYWVIPPLGLILARRDRGVGFVVVMLYALQAMYGAGLNHVRHMFGDFSGSQLLPSILSTLGLHVTDVRGYGFLSVLMGMAGLGQTPPHSHSLLSSLIAFTDIGLNVVLVLVTALAYSSARQESGRKVLAVSDHKSTTL